MEEKELGTELPTLGCVHVWRGWWKEQFWPQNLHALREKTPQMGRCWRAVAWGDHGGDGGGGGRPRSPPRPSGNARLRAFSRPSAKAEGRRGVREEGAGGARVSPAALSQPAWRGSARRGGPLGRAPGRALPTLAAPAPRRPSFPPLPARRHFVAWAPLAVAWPGGHFVKRAAGGAAPAVPRAAATRGRGGAVVPEAGSPRPPPPPSFVRQISSFCYVFFLFFFLPSAKWGGYVVPLKREREAAGGGGAMPIASAQSCLGRSHPQGRIKEIKVYSPGWAVRESLAARRIKGYIYF